jgi:hypothetical protein
MMKSAVFILIVGVFTLAGTASQSAVLTRIDHVRPYRLDVGGFVLDRHQRVSIEAVGLRDGGEHFEASMAWILNADTRDVVWTLDESNSKRRSNDLEEYTRDLDLPSGRYEVYFSTYPAFDWDYNGIGDFISGVFRDRRYGRWDEDDFRSATRDFEIVVSGDGRSLSEKEIVDYHKKLNGGALVSLTELGKECYERLALTLDRPMDMEIYAVGEVRKDGIFDGSWIIDAKTKKRVWQLDYWESEPAGGAKKNRMFKGKAELPAGTYIVYCVTDDSHYFDAWNSAPPYDPYYWGLTMQPADPKMAQYAHVAKYEDVPDKDVVVQLTKLRDSESKSEGFSLKKPTRLRIYAIGEGRGGELFDYSWIINADTHEKVWEMRYHDTEHAGGATKNRMVEDVIQLDKGNYIAYAVTDDSHAYRDWNSSPPYDAEHWGLTVTLDDGGSRKDVSVYRESEDKGILARIVEVGDREREREPFQLGKETKVRVYALGEGRSGRMYDYAWIEEAGTGRVVWEMTYRMTEHAGGAKKNRVFDGTVTLPPGKYELCYESDGSHSFGSWNANPPTDMFNWGVTLRIASGK